jgi:hypothetical protein
VVGWSKEHLQFFGEVGSADIVSAEDSRKRGITLMTSEGRVICWKGRQYLSTLMMTTMAQLKAERGRGMIAMMVAGGYGSRS